MGLRIARASVALDPGNWRARDTLAWALFSNGLHDEAIAESEKAKELAPEDERESHERSLARLYEMVESAWEEATSSGEQK